MRMSMESWTAKLWSLMTSFRKRYCYTRIGGQDRLGAWNRGSLHFDISLSFSLRTSTKVCALSSLPQLRYQSSPKCHKLLLCYDCHRSYSNLSCPEPTQPSSPQLAL